MARKLLKKVSGDWRVNALFGLLALGNAAKAQLDDDSYKRNRSIAQAVGAFALAGLNKRTFRNRNPEEAVNEEDN